MHAPHFCYVGVFPGKKAIWHKQKIHHDWGQRGWNDYDLWSFSMFCYSTLQPSNWLVKWRLVFFAAECVCSDYKTGAQMYWTKVYTCWPSLKSFCSMTDWSSLFWLPWVFLLLLLYFIFFPLGYFDLQWPNRLRLPQSQVSRFCNLNNISIKQK